VAWYGKHFGFKTDDYGSFGGKMKMGMIARHNGLLHDTSYFAPSENSLCKIFV
jgi:hypothetical protein